MKKLTWLEELDLGKHHCVFCNKKLNSDDLLFAKHKLVSMKIVQCSDCGTFNIKNKGKLEVIYVSPKKHPWSKVNENINEGKKLTHQLHCIDGNWYWVCPICGEWLCPHRMDKHHGVDGAWRVLQAKGAASRHLMRHDPSLIQHGRKIEDCLTKSKKHEDFLDKLFEELALTVK